jgi:hypothetical protein
MTMATTDRLADELKKANCPEWMVTKARAGYYDDYKSPLTFPTTMLVNDLTRLGQSDLADRVKDGEFDGTKEEAEEWMRSSEGQLFLNELYGRKR